MSRAKIICTIQTRLPIPIEKHNVIPQMGRFTMRDEGKTIALGKVLKYKPSKLQAATTLGDIPKVEEGKPEEETKAVIVNEDGEDEGEVQINTSTPVVKKPATDLVFDLDSGEMLTKEEYHRRQALKTMDEINEGEEDDEDDEDEEGEEETT